MEPLGLLCSSSTKETGGRARAAVNVTAGTCGDERGRRANVTAGLEPPLWCAVSSSVYSPNAMHKLAILERAQPQRHVGAGAAAGPEGQELEVAALESSPMTSPSGANRTSRNVSASSTVSCSSRMGRCSLGISFTTHLRKGSLSRSDSFTFRSNPTTSVSSFCRHRRSLGLCIITAIARVMVKRVRALELLHVWARQAGSAC
jgi:hypothetical protein